MVTFIDEFAGTSGMMFSPTFWREHFKERLASMLHYTKKMGLYTGLLLDGDIRPIIDDLLEMDIDAIQFVQPHAVGIAHIAEKFKGKRCIRASVDMMTTLATGTPDDVLAETQLLYEKFATDRGGFMPTVLRWHRPEYPPENVAASVEGFRKYR